jgi:hypothetical protein
MRLEMNEALKIENLSYEMMLAKSSGNTKREEELKELIGLLQRDLALRQEMGLESNQGWV